MDEPRMPALLVQHGRPGFYFRVLEEGVVRAGDAIVKDAGGPEQMTVTSVNALLYLGGHHEPELLERALRIPALSPGWQASLRALLDEQERGAPGGGNAGLVAPAPPPAWPGFRPLRVVAKRSESADVVSLELDADDGGPLPHPLAGQFVTLRLELGGGAAPIVRSYSLSGAPDGAHYRISVKVEPRGAAGRHLRDAVDVGDRIDVAAPRGRFTLDDGARPVALVSAGVGVTPVLAMLHSLSTAHTTREVWWFHGARNGTEHAFAREANALLASLPGARSRVWYSRPRADDRIGVDYDEVGRLTADAIVAAGVPTDSEFYLCGPAAFMDSLRAGIDALGVVAARVHTELFGAEGSINPGIVASVARPPHQPEGRAGTGPLVSFARTGLNVRWDDAYASILELAEACDVPVRWSCRTGVCHTCESGLLAGAVAYDPEPLELPAAGNLLVCCSKPSDDLAVDL
jgi:ferredoxin-NADP reductase